MNSESICSMTPSACPWTGSGNRPFLHLSGLSGWTFLVFLCIRISLWLSFRIWVFIGDGKYFCWGLKIVIFCLWTIFCICFWCVFRILRASFHLFYLTPRCIILWSRFLVISYCSSRFYRHLRQEHRSRCGRSIWEGVSWGRARRNLSRSIWWGKSSWRGIL